MRVPISVAAIIFKTRAEFYLPFSGSREHVRAFGGQTPFIQGHVIL
jgi:hypothetical protein